MFCSLSTWLKVDKFYEWLMVDKFYEWEWLACRSADN